MDAPSSDASPYNQPESPPGSQSDQNPSNQPPPPGNQAAQPLPTNQALLHSSRKNLNHSREDTPTLNLTHHLEEKLPNTPRNIQEEGESLIRRGTLQDIKEHASDVANPATSHVSVGLYYHPGMYNHCRTHEWKEGDSQRHSQPQLTPVKIKNKYAP